jgi:CRP-like cAMP-binding protein
MNHFKSELANSLMKISELSDSVLSILLEHINVVNYKKNEQFQPYGEKADKIGFLVQGSMIVKREDLKGNEQVIYFNVPENTPFVGVLESLIQNNNSNAQISALESSILCEINYKTLVDLYANHHELETLGRKLLEQHYLIALEQARFRQNTNASEKNEIFHAKYPEIFDVAEKKDIANYLGINPSSYSRLRKKLKNVFHLTNVKSRSNPST